MEPETDLDVLQKYCQARGEVKMFSAGHVIWICVSFALILCGTIAIRVFRPSLDRLLKCCLTLGVVSEAVKVLSVTNILPMVEPEIQDGAGLVYRP